MKWKLVVVLALLVVSATFVGCASGKKATPTQGTISQETTCPACSGMSAIPGQSIECRKCGNTGSVGRPTVTLPSGWGGTPGR